MAKRADNYKKTIGQVPGAIIYTGEKSNKKLRIEYFDYDKSTISLDEIYDITKVIDFKHSNSTTWINVNGLHYTKQIEKIGQHYDLHPLTLEDIVNTTQRPKFDTFDNYLFVVLKMLYYNDDEELISEQVSFVLGNNYVLTFQESEGDVFNSIRQRLKENKGRIRSLKSDYLLYALIDAVVDYYFSIVEVLGNKIEDLENNLFAGIATDKTTLEIQRLKSEILKVRRAMFPLRDIANRIYKSDDILIHKQTLNYYRDIYDHLIQVTENLDMYREMILSLMDLYMTSMSNKMNEVMKVLTIIATIFIPLTFFSGIYGMNFKYMPELDYKYAYFILWGLMLLIFIAMLMYFRRKKWL